MCKSIFIIPLSEFSKVNGRVAQSTVFELSLFNFTLIHFVFAAFAAVIITSDNGFATDNTSWEITATCSADSVVLAYRFLAITAWTLNPFSRSLFRWVFSEYADSNIDIMFTLFL